MTIRKITSAEEAEKKRKRRNLILSFVLVGIMVLSTFGTGLYMFGGSGNGGESTEQDKITYNGYEFVENNGLWFFSIGEMNFILGNNPNNLLNISTSLINPLNNYQNLPLYIYSEDDLSSQIIYNNLNQVSQRTQEACLALDANETICEGKPIKSCSDNFVILKESFENKIVQENRCAYISAKKEDIGKVTDVFILKVLGIYQD